MPKLTTTTPLKHLSILGSTGSIGRSALAVVDAHPDRLRVVGLAAGENAALLAEQTARYRPEIIATAAEATLGDVRAKLPPGLTPAMGGGPHGLLVGPLPIPVSGVSMEGRLLWFPVLVHERRRLLVGVDSMLVGLRGPRMGVPVTTAQLDREVLR